MYCLRRFRPNPSCVLKWWIYLCLPCELLRTQMKRFMRARTFVVIEPGCGKGQEGASARARNRIDTCRRYQQACMLCSGVQTMYFVLIRRVKKRTLCDTNREILRLCRPYDDNRRPYDDNLENRNTNHSTTEKEHHNNYVDAGSSSLHMSTFHAYVLRQTPQPL